MLRTFIIFVLVLIQTACVNSSTVISGEVSEAIEFDKVELFYNSPPDCEFDVVAHMNIPGAYFSRASLIEAFRHKAAAVGANAVQILDIQQVGVNAMMGSARALRCHREIQLFNPVDKVDLR
jgi:hypothetical protein